MTIVSPPLAKPDAKRASPVVIGHRGSSATHPENTMEAFSHAFQVGAHAVELDVIPTRDGVLAITHDFYTASGQSIRGSNFRELHGISRVEDLAALPDGVFDIEMKTKRGLRISGGDYAAAVVAAIRRTGIQRRTIVRSFDPDILREVHRIAPELALAVLTGNPLHDWVRLAARTNAGAVSPHHRLVSRLRVRRAHRAGLFVMPWTANLPATWERLIAAGVDGIITDDPGALVDYLAARTAKVRRWLPILRRPSRLPATL